MVYSTECLGYIAPFYNLVLVGILLILFFVFFRNPHKKVYLKPWKILLAVTLVYVVEEIMTATGVSEFMGIYRVAHPLFEMIMVGLFIYMLLLQREYLRNLK